MKCPECGFRQTDENPTCKMCGLTFAKLQARPEGRPPPAVTEAGLTAEPLERSDWINLGIGLMLAGVFSAFPMLRFILRMLTVLIHEFGHAVFGWLFAYPSIPRFDFYYGGGITTHEARSTFIYFILAGLYGLLVYTMRKNRFTVGVLAVMFLLYLPVALTSLHDILILFMGHGTELIFGGLFLYRAMTGSGVIKSIERPVYAACGFFIIFDDIRFGYELIMSDIARQLYAGQKGGGHVGDFDRIAIDHLHVSMPTVALFFFICCFLPLVISFLAARYRQYWHAGLWRLVKREH